MGAGDGGGRSLAQTEVSDEAFVDKLTNGACDLFDGHIRVHAVLHEQIQALDAQTTGGFLGNTADGFRAGIQLTSGLAVVDIPTKLRGNRRGLHRRICRDRRCRVGAGEGVAKQLLAGVWALNLRSIEEFHAKLGSGAQHLDHFLAAG